MFEVSKKRTKAILSINHLANICGYFFNSALDNNCNTSPNNGYNCSHPDCGEVVEGIGCCHAWSCPFGWEADEEDCREFGFEYEEGEYVTTDNTEILEKIRI